VPRVEGAHLRAAAAHDHAAVLHEQAAELSDGSGLPSRARDERARPALVRSLSVRERNLTRELEDRTRAIRSQGAVGLRLGDLLEPRRGAGTAEHAQAGQPVGILAWEVRPPPRPRLRAGLPHSFPGATEGRRHRLAKLTPIPEMADEARNVPQPPLDVSTQPLHH
jgi:hypothetical protein